jgi:hypothetical protein
MSLHRSDGNTFYPRREDAAGRFVGQGEGLGFNVNIAWNTGLVANE